MCGEGLMDESDLSHRDGEFIRYQVAKFSAMLRERAKPFYVRRVRCFRRK